MKLNWFPFIKARASRNKAETELQPLRNRSRRKKDNLSSPLQAIQDSIQKERIRLDDIKKKLDSEDYDGALRNLLSDADADLHHFMRLKALERGGGGDGVKSQKDPHHSVAFQERHGKLIDFTYPKEKIPARDCIWIGRGYRNKRYRCHNKSIVCDGKELYLCPYHHIWCINTKCHPDIPVRINCPNESALCNECFVLRYGHAPKQLRRIPGTRKM